MYNKRMGFIEKEQREFGSNEICEKFQMVKVSVKGPIGSGTRRVKRRKGHC